MGKLVKERWPMLTDDDITAIDDNRGEQLVRKIQERYGIANDAPEEYVDGLRAPTVQTRNSSKVIYLLTYRYAVRLLPENSLQTITKSSNGSERTTLDVVEPHFAKCKRRKKSK